MTNVLIKRELLERLYGVITQTLNLRITDVALVYELLTAPSQPASAHHAGEVPEVLLTALRQYRHNYGDNKLIPGYDYEETNRIVAALQARAVVMPERLKEDVNSNLEWSDGWNACIDEVARLNGKDGV